MASKYVIGMDIGGTKISTGLLDNKCNLIDIITLPTCADKEKDVILSQIKISIDTILKNNNLDIAYVKGIGICCPGPLNPKTGLVINPPNLPTLWNTNIKEIIEDLYKTPVKVENDANAAGYAEVVMGAAKGCENILYVTVSTGVGTGIIINKQIYHGKNGFAGEGGHLSANYKGTINCNCNAPDCIEAIASGTGIARKAKELIISGQAQNSLLNQYKDNLSDITAKEISTFALQGDKLAVLIIEESAFTIGAWLGGMINLLDPDMIVIGGGVTSIGDLFFNKVRETSLKFTYNIYADKTPIVPAALKTNVGVLGAASLFVL